MALDDGALSEATREQLIARHSGGADALRYLSVDRAQPSPGRSRAIAASGSR